MKNRLILDLYRKMTQVLVIFAVNYRLGALPWQIKLKPV